jgi:hypothetical protein
MNRQIVIAVLLIATAGGVYYYWSREEKIVTILPSMGPEQVVRFFWLSAFSRDVDMVQRLTAPQPESFIDPCLNNYSSERKALKVIARNLAAEIISSVPSERRVFAESREKLYRLEKESPERYYAVYSVAVLIDSNRMPPEGLNVVSSSTFRDQARITVEFRNDKLSFKDRYAFYLAKYSEGWRIISINSFRDDGSENSSNAPGRDEDGNIVFGKAEPVCSRR